MVSLLIHGDSGFACDLSGSAQTCVLSATSVTLKGGICKGSTLQGNVLIIPTTATLTTHSASIASGTTYVTIAETAIFAPLIQLVWQASDITKTITTSSNIVTSTVASSPSASTPSPTHSAAPSHGLSTGAKAAVGVVASVVIIALLTGLFAYICIRHRRHATAAPAAPIIYNPIDQSAIELHDRQRRAELTGVPTVRHELSAGDMEPELHSPSLIELGGQSSAGKGRS